MPRKLRLEVEGGLYHVINRGNYRSDIFGSAGAKLAFEKALVETIPRFGWRLHAYVIMSNHYHLALETPQPNLTAGMHALQSTFATRFNRLRKEQGHVFQGRFQSLLVQDSAALSRLVDYIHLNPVRAGLESVETLASYPWCSLRRFIEAALLPGQTGEVVMSWYGLPDTPACWRDTLDRLRGLAADESEQKNQGFTEMSRGWAIGTDAWRKSIAKDYAQLSLVGMSAEDAAELRQAKWENVMAGFLNQWTLHDNEGPQASIASVDIPSRLIAAQALRAAGAPYRWITEQLDLGSPENLRIRLYRLKNVTM